MQNGTNRKGWAVSMKWAAVCLTMGMVAFGCGEGGGGGVEEEHEDCKEPLPLT